MSAPSLPRPSFKKSPPPADSTAPELKGDKNSPSVSRLKKQRLILAEAERQFARFGFEGASLETIAATMGVSRQNMLYYYSNKQDLYAAVLDDVLASWLAHMEDMARSIDPATAVSRYVRAKLRFSKERPFGSAVFTREVMSGAPLFGDKLIQQVLPKLRADVRSFERWAKQGKIARVDFTHLMFVIWASTQAYADLSTQFAFFLNKPALEDSDYETASDLITHMVLKSLTA
jgi:TetR/AcrR family transcriptional regulator